MSRRPPALVEAVVGVPMYENVAQLRPAIESLLAQDHPSFAIVAVDDSRSDEPGEKVREYERADARLSYVRNPVRLGLVENWRRAFALARDSFPAARYFAWGSDHDLWEPSWLSSLAGELDANPGAVLAYPQNDVIGVSGEQLAGPWHFDTRGEPRPVRFVRVLRRMVAGDMIYGLVRAGALQRCAVLRDVDLPDRLLLAELSLQGEFRQVAALLRHRRRLDSAAVRLDAGRARLFAGRRPHSTSLPWWVAHAGALAVGLALRGQARPAVGRLTGAAAAGAYLGLAPVLQTTRRAYYAAGGRGRPLPLP